ncbi:hypothetical protein [Senegalia massiliensis]|uniref:hypothetical protein n=1 Tax=Senegalia massiliensis TaxID=1720316 RepID=UPI001032554D|nr:hypothetical protein [Senegalia massiliensis]
MDKEELIECLDQNKEKIIKNIQHESKHKIYFNKYSSSPEEIIYMAANDTIEALKIIIEIERYSIFRNKIKWFKSMIESRTNQGKIKENLLEFMELVKLQIEKNCLSDEKISIVFENMMNIIREEF